MQNNIVDDLIGGLPFEIKLSIAATVLTKLVTSILRQTSTVMVAAHLLLDSISAGAGFLFYLAASLWASLRDDSKSGRSERRMYMGKKHKRERKNVQRSGLFFAHLFGNLALFALSLSHAILLAKSRKDRLSTRADPGASAVLFGSLIWLVFFLGLTDAENAAGYEQLIPWMLSLVTYAISTAISTATDPRPTANILVQWIRMLILLGLVVSTALLRQKKTSIGAAAAGSPEETEPLVAPDSQTNGHADPQKDDFDDDDDKSVKSYASDEDQPESKDEDDDNDAKKEETKQRKALRDRPWYQYIASFAIFIPYVRPRTSRQYFYLTIMVINTVIASAITVGQPLMLRGVIDDLTQREFKIWKILAYVFLRFASSNSGTQLIRNMASYRLNTELHNTLLTLCFNHVMDLDARYHISKNTPSTWQIMDRGRSVVDLLQEVCFDHIPVVADLVIALFVVGKIFGAYLCFVVATTMILLSWSNRITMTKKTKMRRYYVDLWRNWYSHMNESFMHWRTVSEFNNLVHEKKRHEEKTEAFTTVSIKQQSFRNYLAAIQEVVVTAGFTFVCIISAMEIAAGRLDIGQFVFMITYWGRIISPVTRIAGFASDIAEELVDAEKLMLLLEKKPRVTTKPNAPKFVFKGGHVKFENCDFSYDGIRPVTKNVSFEAKPGDMVALVGETGGGKSTIFNLLYRFFDPSSGRVLVDGQDISDVNLQSYRHVLGLVPQDTILFNTSILKNIRYGDLNATKAEVIEACKAAQFHDKVEKFPKKYLQKVGELAQKLSGGEKQRLAIARAILKKPGILLLDEATSAVDSVTESKIQASLEKLSEGRTTFVIAHRLSTIMGADKILVVKNGEIVEAGNHQELLDHGNGAYKELWEAQLKLSGGKTKGQTAEVAKGIEESAHGQEQDLMGLDDSETKVDAEKGEISETSNGDKGPGQVDDVDHDHAEDEASKTVTTTVGLVTPPASSEVNSRKGSLTQEEQQPRRHGVSKDTSESSSAKSVESKNSRGYGTL